MIKYLQYYQPRPQPQSSCLEYTHQHSGLCRIPTAKEKRDEKHRRNQELFASLDDDNEVMFGDGVEDY